MTSPAIVRFAPSPTGPPHLGNLRTALYNWLLARATGGRFILRIDDTDQERYSAEAERLMIDALEWIGLTPDEGPHVGGIHAPYRQSERLDLYRAAIDYLLASGHAYRCTCTQERLEGVQARLRSLKKPQVYDNHCRELNITAPDQPHVIRLKMPLTGDVTVHDLVRGEIRTSYQNVAGDIVLVKSDGFPTYHLATVVDDQAMGITHIIRGEEWLPSTPLHLRLFEAMGWNAPAFIHLPLVTDRAGRKIKKRDPSFEVSTYREAGFLPEAVANALALLGWNPGSTDEVFSLPELVERFNIERLSKSPAAFDEEKLRWFNRQHLVRLPLELLTTQVQTRLSAAYPDQTRAADWWRELSEMMREEIGTFADLDQIARPLFEAVAPNESAREALAAEQARPVLEACRDRLEALADLNSETAAELTRALRADFKNSHSWKAQQVMLPLRVTLTGTTSGPHLSDMMRLMGKEICLQRIHEALDLL
jgi:glutamyl-tRNA synthetase